MYPLGQGLITKDTYITYAPWIWKMENTIIPEAAEGNARIVREV
jgi:hypothetical protein